MEKKDAGKNWILQYWQIITFLAITCTGIIIGYADLKKTVYGSEALAKSTSETVSRHEIQISEQGIQLQHIKETLVKIERQNEKLDDKIDKVLNVVITKK